MTFVPIYMLWLAHGGGLPRSLDDLEGRQRPFRSHFLQAVLAQPVDATQVFTVPGRMAIDQCSSENGSSVRSE